LDPDGWLSGGLVWVQDYMNPTGYKCNCNHL